jgi:hypothetical protein
MQMSPRLVHLPASLIVSGDRHRGLIVLTVVPTAPISALFLSGVQVTSEADRNALLQDDR